jgi:putative transposase
MNIPNISKPHRRRCIRLSHFDYSQPGAYFVTICTHNRQPTLGEIRSGIMGMNESGSLVAETWQWLSKQYPYVQLGEWTVMPNHFHGILIITDRSGGSRPALRRRLRRGETAPTKPLGRLVGAFKTVSTKRINEFHKTLGEVFWQRSYFDHVIRSENSFFKISEYIINNPLSWHLDKENDLRQGRDAFDDWLGSVTKEPKINDHCHTHP